MVLNYDTFFFEDIMSQLTGEETGSLAVRRAVGWLRIRDCANTQGRRGLGDAATGPRGSITIALNSQRLHIPRIEYKY